MRFIHAVLACLALGASPQQIRDRYDEGAPMQRVMPKLDTELLEKIWTRKHIVYHPEHGRVCVHNRCDDIQNLKPRNIANGHPMCSTDTIPCLNEFGAFFVLLVAEVFVKSVDANVARYGWSFGRYRRFNAEDDSRKAVLKLPRQAAASVATQPQ